MSTIPWQQNFYQQLLNRLNTYGYNLNQLKAIRNISNPDDNLPNKARQPLNTLIPRFPRLSVALEQRNFIDLTRRGIVSVTKQIIPGNIIIGPPGTGKTEVICMGSLLFAFKKGPWTPKPSNRKKPFPNQQVLIGTFTNAGSERVIQKMYEIASNLGFARNIINSVKLAQASDRINRGVPIHVPDKNFIISPDGPPNTSENQWSKTVNGFNIIVGTIYTLYKIQKYLNSALIVVDEASQLTVPQLNLLISRVSPAGLSVVGDDKQLPPVVKLKPLSLSALIYLMGTRTYQNIPIPRSRRTTLEIQYRMHPAIGDLTSKILRGTRKVLHGQNTLTNLLSNYQDPKFLQYLSDPSKDFIRRVCDPKKPVVILDTSNLNQAYDIQMRNSRYNPIEADIVRILVQCIRQSYNLKNSDIIITSPYSSQKEGLRRGNPDVRSGTIHSFQGQEAEVVIYSLTFASRGSGSSFFAQTNLMYVGLSRAKRKLVIVGNKNNLNGTPQIREIRDIIFNYTYRQAVLIEILDQNIIDEIKPFT